MSDCTCFTEHGPDGAKTFLCPEHKLTPEKVEIKKLQARVEELEKAIRWGFKPAEEEGHFVVHAEYEDLDAIKTIADVMIKAKSEGAN